MNLINNKTEEIVKWRQQQDINMNYNHGENSPSFLSRHQQQQGETPANSLNSPFKKNCDEVKNNPAKFYITLAKESPKHDNEYDSDDTATYDSYHDRTTDVCMDSCDTESNTSEYLIQGIATVEVLEYDVASASASEDLYSNDSSSGTDDDLFEMAKEILETVDKRSGCGFWSSDFADTEESDNSDNCIDSELSPADYWLCVKCKNRQNNPMFRYCEKCYQIRKTHFPPRPTKLRKTRQNRKRKSPIFSHIDSRRKSSSTPKSKYQNELISADIKISNILDQQITSYTPDASTSNNQIGKNQMNLTNSNIIKFNKISEENSKLNGNNIITNNSKHNNGRYKKRKLNYTNSTISQLNSAAETSSSYDDDDVSYSTDSFSSFENSSNFGKKFYSPNKIGNNNLNLKIKSQIPNTSNSANITFNNLNFNNRKRKASIVTDGNNIDSEICSQPKIKFLNNIIKPNSDINLNSDYSETDLFNNRHLVSNEIIFDKDSGISSAPSTQDYGELAEFSQPHCSTSIDDKLNEPNTKISNNQILITKDSLINNMNQLKDDGNESSDTVCEELNEKDVVELQENLIFSPELDESICNNTEITNSMNNFPNNKDKQNILNNLDRHSSEFSPIANKINHDSLIPRSISEINNCKTNLRTIELPKSPSTIALNNNNSNNCTANFDDKLSLLLNPSDNPIDSSYGLCIICVTEPKNGAFVHNRFVHLSCCYKCAVKIWNKNKKCPICNCAVKNVMKLFVH